MTAPASYDPPSRMPITQVEFETLITDRSKCIEADIRWSDDNPTCSFVGEKHKHQWSGAWKDKEAYAPDDIAAGVDAVRDV